RVSVVLVARDGQPSTRDAIALVTSQGPGGRREVIVVEDGPPSAAPEPPDAGDLSATIVRQPTLGFGAALNHGVLVARGEHLALLGPGEVPLVIPRRAFAEVGPFPPAMDQAAWDEWRKWTGGPPGRANRP